MTKALFIEPHPGDLLIGAASYLYKLLLESGEINIFGICRGDSKYRSIEGDERTLDRQSGTERFTKLYNIPYTNLKIKNRHLERSMVFVKEILREKISAYAPDLIFLPSRVDLNPQHILIHDWIIEVSPPHQKFILYAPINVFAHNKIVLPKTDNYFRFAEKMFRCYPAFKPLFNELGPCIFGGAKEYAVFTSIDKNQYIEF